MDTPCLSPTWTRLRKMWDRYSVNAFESIEASDLFLPKVPGAINAPASLWYFSFVVTISEHRHQYRCSSHEQQPKPQHSTLRQIIVLGEPFPRKIENETPQCDLEEDGQKHPQQTDEKQLPFTHRSYLGDSHAKPSSMCHAPRR